MSFLDCVKSGGFRKHDAPDGVFKTKIEKKLEIKKRNMFKKKRYKNRVDELMQSYSISDMLLNNRKSI